MQGVSYCVSYYCVEPKKSNAFVTALKSTGQLHCSLVLPGPVMCLRQMRGKGWLWYWGPGDDWSRRFDLLWHVLAFSRPAWVCSPGSLRSQKQGCRKAVSLVLEPELTQHCVSCNFLTRRSPKASPDLRGSKNVNPDSTGREMECAFWSEDL